MSRAHWLVAILVLTGCGAAPHVATRSRRSADSRRAPPKSDACRFALAPDGASVLVALDNGITLLLALPSGAPVRRYDLQGTYPTALEFSPDGKWFVTSSWQRELDIWSSTSGQHLASLRAVEGLDAGYIVTPSGQVRFVGKDRKQAKRYAACRFGDLTLEFEVCEDSLTP
jgi:WD40 repeat protein